LGKVKIRHSGSMSEESGIGYKSLALGQKWHVLVREFKKFELPQTYTF